MKLKTAIITLVVALFATTAWAATDVTLVWDPNTEADIDGYRLYQSVTSGTYNKDADKVADVKHADVCGETQCQTTITVEDGTWYWVATAYDTYGNESDYSNEVTETLDSTPPAPPSNLWIKLKEIIVATWNWLVELFA